MSEVVDTNITEEIKGDTSMEDAENAEATEEIKVETIKEEKEQDDTVPEDHEMTEEDTADTKDEKAEIKKEKTSVKEQTEESPDDSIVDDTEVTKITSLKTLDRYLASKDNSQNVIYLQDIPDICKKEPCMLGVDEAGRGPVLGPMVYGIAFCPLTKKQALIDLGCADSKQLTEEKREIIFEEMHTEEYAASCVGWAVEVISPNTISTSMNRRTKYSLNEVSMGSAIGLIHCAIDAGVNIAEVYVDTVGPPEKYQEKLKAIFPRFKITVAKKADSTYPIVSAASICAKVTRDHALKVWKFREGLVIKDNNFGSGYPGDPVTKRFLTDNIDMVFGYPRLVRFSWSTAENALADKAYDMEFDEPESEKPKYAGPKLTKFFKGTTKTGEVKREQSRFFRERFLNAVVDF